MEIIGLGLLVGFVVWLVLRVNKKKHKSNEKKSKRKNESLKAIIEKEFKKHYVIEKNGKTMICEQDTKGFIKELVYISINPNQGKSVKKSGSYMIVSYPKKPTLQEIKKDFGEFLN